MKFIYKTILSLFAVIIMTSTAYALEVKSEQVNPKYKLRIRMLPNMSSKMGDLVLKIGDNPEEKIKDDYMMLLVNGTLINNANIVIKNERSLVPIRKISEAIDSKVDWDEKLKKVTISKASNKIELFINKKEAIVNNKKVTLDVAPQIIGESTYLPVRFISENMNCVVDFVDTKEKGYSDFVYNDFPFFFRTIIIEEKTERQSMSSSECLKIQKSKLESSISDYEKLLTSLYGKDSADIYVKILKNDIPKLKFDGNIGRYYQFSYDGVGNYLVDKYTGQDFIFSRNMSFRGIESMLDVYPSGFVGLAN